MSDLEHAWMESKQIQSSDGGDSIGEKIIVMDVFHSFFYTITCNKKRVWLEGSRERLLCLNQWE